MLRFGFSGSGEGLGTRETIGLGSAVATKNAHIIFAALGGRLYVSLHAGPESRGKPRLKGNARWAGPGLRKATASFFVFFSRFGFLLSALQKSLYIKKIEQKKYFKFFKCV